MPKSVLPFLMFQGEGAAALDFYLLVFPGAVAEDVVRYDETGPGPAGTLRMARLKLADQTILLNDSPIRHAFTFTPSVSMFVECGSADEVRQLGDALKEGGAELMPAANYGFSSFFTWVSDRFGVSWQINLA